MRWTTPFYNPIEYCILFPLRMNDPFNYISNVIILSLTCSWYHHGVVLHTRSVSTHHTMILTSSSQPLHVPLCAFRLPYINKLICDEIYLPCSRVKLLPVTFFVAWSYLLPRQKCQTGISPETGNLNQPISILHTPKTTTFYLREFCDLVTVVQYFFYYNTLRPRQNCPFFAGNVFFEWAYMDFD